MEPHISYITLGVVDLERTKKFYGEGLGWPIEVEQGHYVAFRSSDGSSALTLYPRAALAGDAGTDPEGSGFTGITLSHVVGSEVHVDSVLAEAKKAGGSIVRPAQSAQWGGYFGYFADPDGHLWKVVVEASDQ